MPASSTSTRIVVSTSVGYESVPCGVNGTGTAFCLGYLMGDPLIGATLSVSSAGTRVASGLIASTSTFPTFIPID